MHGAVVLTSSVDVQTLLVPLSLDGFVEQNYGFLKEIFRETFYCKIIVCEKELSLCVHVEGVRLIVIGFIQGQKIIVDS